MIRFRSFLIMVASMLLAAGACSLPTDDEATLINPDDLPDVLRSDLEVTTTINQGRPTEPIQIYLLGASGERTIVVPVGRELDPQASFAQEVGLLFAPEIRTEEEIENGWFNALRDFQLVEAFINDNQVAIIDMVAIDENGEPITVGDQVLADAVAQLVYTVTALPKPDPILAVRVRIAGETAFLPTLEGDTADVVDRSDFANYDAEFVPPTTAPPTTTTPDPANVEPDS